MRPGEIRRQQQNPYVLQMRADDSLSEHRIGVFTPPGSKRAAHVRVEIIKVQPHPRDDGGSPSVPKQIRELGMVGGIAGITIMPGQEQLYVLGTTETDANGVTRAPDFTAVPPGTPLVWTLGPKERWVLHCRVTSDERRARKFKVVISARSGHLRIDLA